MADDSLQSLLEQLAKILETAKNASKMTLKGPPPPDAEKQLRTIQGMVAYFKGLNDALLKRAGISEEEIANPPKPVGIPPTEPEGRLLEDSRRLANDAKRSFDDLSFALKQIKKKKTSPKSRKKKFDRLGGRKKWKPL